MRIEIGAFGSFRQEGIPNKVFAARVVIPRDEFASFGLGDHELPDAAPACFRWCVAEFGIGGARWGVRLPEDGDATVYFAEPTDAFAFFMRWSVVSTEEIQLAA